jgi:copper(I)-binding protein
MNRLFAPSIPRTILLSFALSLAISLPALAASDSELKVANGWISLPIFDEDPSAYFVLQSKSKKTRTIVAATSPKSEGVSIRRTAVIDGQWGSAAMPEGMPVPAGGAVAFLPRGLFLRLMSAEPMAVGDSIKIVLEFADGEKLPFEAIVKED